MCDSEFEEFPNILASCAFNIIKDKYSCSPGTVYPNMIDEYYDGLEMRHIYFIAPYYWEELDGFELDENYVTWLLAIPISDNELAYLEQYGDDAFESLLEEKEAEIFDLYRRSVI